MLRINKAGLNKFINEMAGLGFKASPVAGAMTVNAIGGVLWWFLAFRWSQPEQAGYFVAVMGIGILIGEISNFGIGYVFLRYLPTAGKLGPALIRTGLTIVTAIAFVGVALLSAIKPLIIAYIPPEGEGWFPITFLIIVLGNAWYALTDNILLATGQRKFFLIRAIGFSTARLILLFFFAFSKQLQWFSMVMSYFLPEIFAAIIAYIFLYKSVTDGARDRFFIKFSKIRFYASYAIESHVGNLIGAVAPNLMPAIILSRLGPIAGAQYGAMWSIAGLIGLLPTAISLSSLSIAARGEMNIKNMVLQGVLLIFAISIPLIAIISVFVPILLPFLGKSYADINGNHLLPLLVSVLCISLSAQVYSRARLVRHGLRLVIAGQSLQMFTILFLAIFLTSFIGLIGVSYAWLFGAAATLIVVSVIGLPKVAEVPVDISFRREENE